MSASATQVAASVAARDQQGHAGGDQAGNQRHLGESDGKALDESTKRSMPRALRGFAKLSVLGLLHLFLLVSSLADPSVARSEVVATPMPAGQSGATWTSLPVRAA